MTQTDDPQAFEPLQSDPDAAAPSLELIARLAADTIAGLPAPWQAAALLVALRVEEFASDEMIEAMDLHDPFELTGLYEGIPMTEKSALEQPMAPDVVWLFRRAILDEWVERGNVSLKELVAHVTIHEFAHHFGWSDEDIAAIDRWWE